MGDSRRFFEFSDLIADQFPNRDVAIADVAGGRGGLQAQLRCHQFTNVVSWDTRRSYAKNRPGYRYGLFDWRTAPNDYGLVVGMHPDGGTDHIIVHAAKRRIPFCVCPCCVVPSGAAYGGVKDYGPWVDHLIALAQQEAMSVSLHTLPIAGRNTVLIGRPL